MRVSASKLALGTAQFGLDYGIANTGGQIPIEEADRILVAAREVGIDTIDTAISYGDSEERLGRLGVDDWKVISKVPALPESIVDVNQWLVDHVRGSLSRLGVRQLDGLLLHRPIDILCARSSEYVQALTFVRSEGLVRSIGYSIYSPDELADLVAVFPPDIIQSPYSIIDRRLVTSGWMKRLTEAGVRIHTRSTFLQGLLLVSGDSRPSWCNRWKSLWQTFSEECDALNTSPLALSLGYVLSQPLVERVVVGVDTFAHFQQVVQACSQVSPVNFPELACEDLGLIDPTRWGD